MKQPGFETRDFSPRKAFYAGLVGVATLLAIGVGLLFLQRAAVPRDRLARAPGPESPAGEIEFESGALRSAYEQGEAQRLGSYAWIDRDHHLARIPITRAEEIYIERAAREAP